MTERVSIGRTRFIRFVLWAVIVGGSFALGAVMFRRGKHDVPMGRSEKRSSTSVGATSQETFWTCSMHPQIHQPSSGKCPLCGMDLIEVSKNDAASTPSEQLSWSERAKTLARLRTSKVRRRNNPSQEVRLLGRVEANESSLKTITSWIGGRIDRLHVTVTGERIKAGQVIATLYSPDVFAAHQDLLVAKRQMTRSSDATKSATKAVYDAARERLKLLGVVENELTRLESDEQPTKQIAIRAAFGGTVIERIASEGAYVETGSALYRVADLSNVWVQLEAYESDLQSLSTGQRVRIEVEALPHDEFEGKITFIEPILDARKRTTRVRVEVRNRDGKLRPGMFAHTVVKGDFKATEEPSPLVIPDTAPLFTGRRAVVYVEVPQAEKPTYEARIVRLGPHLGDVYPVVSGLSEGELVVTRGAFALDADLQIRGGASMMTLADDAEEQRRAHIVIELPRRERDKLRPVFLAYLDLGGALASDDLATAKRAAEMMLKYTMETNLLTSEDAQAIWRTTALTLRRSAGEIAHASSIEAARNGFEAISDDIQHLLAHLGNPLDEPVHLAFCPMAFGSRGASWIQRGTEIQNAYFGSAMRTCGEIKNTVEGGAHLEHAQRAKTKTGSANKTNVNPHAGHAH